MVHWLIKGRMASLSCTAGAQVACNFGEHYRTPLTRMPNALQQHATHQQPLTVYQASSHHWLYIYRAEPDLPAIRRSIFVNMILVSEMIYASSESFSLSTNGCASLYCCSYSLCVLLSTKRTHRLITIYNHGVTPADLIRSSRRVAL